VLISGQNHLISRKLSRRKINFKANIPIALKRTKILPQSDLSDFVFEPGNLFQGGFCDWCKM
jgi:hypothetical protein